MAPRQPLNRPRRKPPLTTTRFKHMVRDLSNLYAKYQGDLDEVIPLMWWSINNARARAERMQNAPKAGAPGLWTEGQLARLWVTVRVRRIQQPELTVRDVCKLLAKANFPRFDENGDLVPERGYAVWADEPRSIRREEIERHVTNAETLRRRYEDAEKLWKQEPAAVKYCEEEAQWFVEMARKAASSRAAIVRKKGVQKP
jgi:hypothetical protein